MIHPFPKGIAVSYCPSCAIVRAAKHVNKLDQIPRRFCQRCGMVLAVALYTLERELPYQGEEPGK